MAGFLVFVLDFAKGYLACALLFYTSAGQAWLVAGAALLAILGHNVSIFLKGRGGKGSAIGVGILWFISPWAALIATLLVALLIFLSGFVSVASLVASALIPILFYWWQLPLPYLLLSLLAFAIIWLKHIANIKRLLKGEENPIYKKALLLNIFKRG
jgi:glycerol-3-phosphate acyltransferase PlsY